jgi:hypothetical protein
MDKYYSSKYQSMLIDMHKKRPWGGAVDGSIERINTYARLSEVKSILDYGSGYGAFKDKIEATYTDVVYSIHEYEPGQPELAGDPPICDASICIDVMEHIEPKLVDNVIEHIHNKTNKWTFQKICLRAATGNFPGTKQNLHLIVMPAAWWVKKLSPYWEMIDLTATTGHLTFLGLKKS